MKSNIALVVGILSLWIFIPDVSAQHNKKGTIEVVPAYLDVELPGNTESKKIEIGYINHSDRSVTLELLPIDFKQQGEYGGIGFLGQSSQSYSYSLSSFLSFESNQIDLAPGEKRTFKVTVNNREDLSPGGHYAAVVAKVSTDISDSTVTPVAPSVSSLLLIRKNGGERFNLSLIRSDWPGGWLAWKYPRSFNILFQNEGNVHVVPYGRIEVKDFLGRLIAVGAVNSSSLYIFPEVRRYIASEIHPVSWSLPISFNTVTITGQDSLKKVSYSHVNSYLYINPYFAGIAVLLVIFGGLIVMKRRRRK